MRLIITLIIVAVASITSAQSPLTTHYNRAKEAYDNKDYETYLYHTSKADSISPNHPTLTYNLASAYALTGNHPASLKHIKKAVLMNTKLYPQEDADFDAIRNLDGFKEITQLKNEFGKEIAKSEVAFINAEKDLHPESIAYDSQADLFYIGSVHKNKIVMYSPKSGKAYDWKESGEDGLWAVMGMQVDTKNNFLWACTTATKEMTGFAKELEGKTALFKYDLTSKKLLKRYELEGGHWFGDVILSKDGTPYISDSMKPIIYTIKDDKLSVFKDFTGELFNLQGLAFNKDETVMYIADYKIGLQIYDLQKEVVKPLTYINDISTKGTDGLYFYKDHLISIQNGVFPMRVSAHQLTKDGSAIAQTNYLDRGRAELDEPTLGVVVGDELYYIANSPWGKYDKEGKLSIDKLTDNIILKCLLEK